MNIIIDGIDFTDSTIFPDDFTETINLNSETGVSINYSSTIKIKSTGYNKLKSIFRGNTCIDKDKIVDVIVTTAACEPITYMLKMTGISWIDELCEARINLISDQGQNDLNKWLGVPFWSYKTKYIDQAISSGNVHKILFVINKGLISHLMVLMYYSISPVIIAVKLMLGLLNKLLRKKNEIHIEFLERLENDLLGGGEYHTAPNINNIFEYWSSFIGVKWSSSILQTGIYNDLALYMSTLGKGINIDKANTDHWDGENEYNISPLELLTAFKKVFNADFKLINKVLYFERKDKIESLALPVFNLKTESDQIIEHLELTMNDSNYNAYFKGTYQRDAADTIGNKLLNDYSDNVEWNPKGLDSLKGVYLADTLFSPAAFTNDGYSSIVLEEAWYNSGKNIRLGYDTFAHALVQGAELVQNLKLLMIDKGRYRSFNGIGKFSEVKKRKIGSNIDGGKFVYNEDLWFDNDNLNGELYKRFYKDFRPENNLLRLFEGESLTIKPNNFSTFVTLMKANSYYISVTHEELGEGIPQKIVINYNSKTVKFENIKFRCH